MYMMLSRATVFALISFLLVTVQVHGEETSVEVQALLGDTAVLLVNGQRKTLRVGQSFAGVTLVATQPTAATLEINGRSNTVGLSQRVGSSFQEPQEQVVNIARDTRMQYQTNALINGRSALVLVDTGASAVAISSVQARSMNIDYSAGYPTKVETASGMTDAYGITLQSVSVGGIQVSNVPAMVVRGDYPATILLGMTYLQHVKMQEQNGILSLSRSQ
jgi:aspartyl protease family protein